MRVYNRYIDSKDCTWYDSSNVYYSECQDSQSDVKQLKVVFKGGQTYLYHDVSINDYFMFRDADSNGSAIHKYIKKYSYVRLPDTNVAELEERKKRFMEEENIVIEENRNNRYTVILDKRTNALTLKSGEDVIFTGTEGEISAIALLKSMAISFKLVEEETIQGSWNTIELTEEDLNNILEEKNGQE